MNIFRGLLEIFKLKFENGSKENKINIHSLAINNTISGVV